MKAFPNSRYAVFAALAIAGCTADLATKSWAFARLGMPGQNPPWWLWQGYVGLETSLNEGALFGMGQGWVTLFAALSFAALFGVLYWLFPAGAAADLPLTIALGMITGGIFGNLYDRLGLHGLRWTAALKPEAAGEPVYAVRDFILFQASHDWRWPNFNLADSLLVGGVALLVGHALLVSQPGRQAAGAAHLPSGPAETK